MDEIFRVQPMVMRRYPLARANRGLRSKRNREHMERAGKLGMAPRYVNPIIKTFEMGGREARGGLVGHHLRITLRQWLDQNFYFFYFPTSHPHLHACCLRFGRRFDWLAPLAKAPFISHRRRRDFRVDDKMGVTSACHWPGAPDSDGWV